MHRLLAQVKAILPDYRYRAATRIMLAAAGLLSASIIGLVVEAVYFQVTGEALTPTWFTLALVLFAFTMLAGGMAIFLLTHFDQRRRDPLEQAAAQRRARAVDQAVALVGIGRQLLQRKQQMQGERTTGNPLFDQVTTFGAKACELQAALAQLGDDASRTLAEKLRAITTGETAFDDVSIIASMSDQQLSALLTEIEAWSTRMKGQVHGQ
ncbi:MAG: hypothetical protein WD534_06965 [Phycisphaeraceae bacterium]